MSSFLNFAYAYNSCDTKYWLLYPRSFLAILVNGALGKYMFIDSYCFVQVGMLVFWPHQCILADFVEGTEIVKHTCTNGPCTPVHMHNYVYVSTSHDNN